MVLTSGTHNGINIQTSELSSERTKLMFNEGNTELHGTLRTVLSRNYNWYGCPKLIANISNC